MADGSVVINVKTNTSQANKDLAKLKKEIQKTEDTIGEQEAKKSPLVLEAEQLRAKMRVARAEVKKFGEQWAAGVAGADGQQAKASERLSQIESEYAKVVAEIDKIDKKLLPAYEKLDRMKEEAGALQQNIDRASDSTRKMERATKKAEKKMGIFATRLRGILLSAFVFNIMSAGFRDLTDWMGNSIKTNEKARASLAKLKAALLTLAQPLVDVVIPAFTKFIDILTALLTRIGTVISSLFGTTWEEANKSAESLYNEQKALEGVGTAAKEANKQLASFDEINKLSGQNSSASTGAILPDFSGLEISTLPEWLTSLTANMHDILFKWEDLTAEDVLKKLVTSLTALAGTIIGFKVGGLFGAAIGMTVGATLGALISDMTFDNDGVLSKKEILKILRMALFSLVGGVIGFSVGGIGGAALGTTVGAGASVLLSDMIFDNDGVLDKEEILTVLGEALGALVGGVIGFVVGGVGGAAVGAIVGAGASVLLSDMIFDNDGVLGKEEVLKILSTALGALVGGAIGFFVGGPGGAAIGATLGAGASIYLSDLIFDNDGVVSKDEVLKILCVALGALVGGVIGFFVGGPGGAAIGATIGAGVTIKLTDVLFEGFDTLKEKVPGFKGIGPDYSWMFKSKTSVPGLATGSVVPPNREFLAVLGDNKTETEVVSPISTMKQAFREAMMESGGVGGNMTITIKAGPGMARYLSYELDNENTRKGGKLVVQK